MSNRMKFGLLFLFLFVFRTGFGLSEPFFYPDELQTYLIGLKWYCTHGWPYFGPDLIVTETGFQVQIPGALEGLLVGTPLFLLPIPEAPLLLLNLLSLSALALFAWYLSKRLPEIPFVFIFPWIALLPWNLNESTAVLNPAYLLFGSLLFFIGFMEAVPSLAIGFLSIPWAFALMGFGLFWDIQFHFSWVLLPPFLFLALFFKWRGEGFSAFFRYVGFSILGAAPLAALLLPTLLKYGWTHAAGGAGMSQLFNVQNILSIFTILARYLSLACYELPRFVGYNTADRLDFLKQAPWLILPGLFLLVVGWIQPFVLWILGVLFALGWKKDPRHLDALAVYRMGWGTFFLIYLTFWFTSKEPLAHIYYITLPVVVVFSFYVWSRLALYPFWRAFGKVCLAASLLFQLGFAVHMFPKRSLYLNRSQVVKAIQEKNYHLLGERRAGSLY